MKIYNTAWFQQVLSDLENSDPAEHYLCHMSATFSAAWKTVPWFRPSLVELGEQWIKEKRLTGINTSAGEKFWCVSYLFWTHQENYLKRRIAMKQARKDFLLWLIENNHTIEEPQQQ